MWVIHGFLTGHLIFPVKEGAEIQAFNTYKVPLKVLQPHGLEPLVRGKALVFHTLDYELTSSINVSFSL